MDFIALDFEIANNDLSSACSLGMVFVDDKKIVDDKYYLIKPPRLKVEKSFSKVHGLTEEDLKNARTFDEIWQEISGYFNTDTLVVAHNAYFDMSVLKSCLLHYSLEIPEFNYACSIPISTRGLNGFKVGNSLKARVEHFGVTLDQHHNALSDARACAEVVLKCVELKQRESLQTYCSTFSSIPLKSFTELKPQTSFYPRARKTNVRKSFNSVSISEISPTNDKFDDKHPLFEKNLVFTGELTSVDRAKAMQLVVDKGAVIKSGVSGKTDYLVVGQQDPSIVGPDGLSSKERKAQELMKKESKIKILREKEFLKLLS
ncbi:exonuclease [Bacillus sp. LL01]|uniref:exonuclease domain-containing protein n=1 Tax=Bacillus sp. LL01 TaxID=1665556 RepID=UPI00064CEE33|nr:exonuclease domain-containing protein [Bacillus sp. LL01]KMJ58401.1 exonuclease [Bacillus sp. LL01]